MKHGVNLHAVYAIYFIVCATIIPVTSIQLAAKAT